MIFANICELMTPVLAGPSRAEIVAAAARAPRLADALAHLAEGLRAHAFHSSQGPIRFAKLVERFDGLTRAEGVLAMHEWNAATDEVNADSIPVDVLRYIAEIRRNDATDPRVLAILLDYYFLHVLALLSLRVWDDGDANANLGRLQRTLDALQGPSGSGHRFVDDAETLILLATSHYARDDRGFTLLLDRVRTLGRSQQLKIAIGHASSLGCHLRFGFETTYAKSTDLMRADNDVDYPWLRYALTVLFDELDAASAHDSRTRAAIVDALVGGLTADATWCADDPEIAARVAAHRSELCAAFEALRPTDADYSPQALFYNFSHTVLKGAVVDAMLWGEPWPVTLNDLLSGHADRGPHAAPLAKRQALATTLMDYARTNPHRMHGRAVPVIVYDPATGRRVCDTAAQALHLTR
jgi:hypothetical protein